MRAAARAGKSVREEAGVQARRAETERVVAAKAAAYDKRLDHLAIRIKAAWQEIADLIETKKPRDYDLAVSLLRDLSALARRDLDPGRGLTLCSPTAATPRSELLRGSTPSHPSRPGPEQPGGLFSLQTRGGTPLMTTIGIIGAGEVGSQLARAAIASGYDVVIANSRGPETLTRLTKQVYPAHRRDPPSHS